MGREPIDALEYELLHERAAALGRIAAKMEEAITALRAFDAAPGAPAVRAALLAEAREWLWYYVVQREAMGWNDHEAALDLLGVPAEVRLCMGPRRR